MIRKTFQRGVFVLFLVISPALQAADAPLADAAEKSDRPKIRALIKGHADVNQSQVDGMTALHWAVAHDDLDTARLLIGAKAEIKAVNRYGVSPLSIACTNGSDPMVAALLEAGADPNTKLPGDESALMTASRTGKLGPVRSLIARGAEVNARERKGQTALMWAAAEGNAEVCQALLEAGADFRTALASGFTPLFFAVREGRIEAARVLLRAGADVNGVMNPEKSTGKAPSKGTSPLVLAVENGHFELAVVMLEAGADPDDQRSGHTALHTLTWVRKPNRGDDESGDPSPIGSGTLTSLGLVAKLVEHHADVNLQLKRGASGRGVLNRAGATPFLLASMTADVPLMRELLKFGADPLLPNSTHSTPLMAASGLGTLAPSEEAGTEDEALEAVKLLLELGGDINGVDDNGETAMHGAAYKSFPRMVQFLADHGAKLEIWNRKDRYGWTPLSIAEGYRPGNFKPSIETLAALHKVMRASGVTPPASAAPTESKPAYPKP